MVSHIVYNAHDFLFRTYDPVCCCMVELCIFFISLFGVLKWSQHFYNYSNEINRKMKQSWWKPVRLSTLHSLALFRHRTCNIGGFIYVLYSFTEIWQDIYGKLHNIWTIFVTWCARGSRENTGEVECNDITSDKKSFVCSVTGCSLKHAFQTYFSIQALVNDNCYHHGCSICFSPINLIIYMFILQYLF